MNGNGSTGGGLMALLQSPMAWEIGFIVALVLLIGAHKITLEGMISA